VKLPETMAVRCAVAGSFFKYAQCATFLFLRLHIVRSGWQRINEIELQFGWLKELFTDHAVRDGHLGPDNSRGWHVQASQFPFALQLVSSSTDLRQLKLCAPTHTNPGPDFFTSSSASCRRLATLHLSSINLGRPNILSSIPATSGHTLSNVEDLSFKSCNIGDAGAASLAALMSHMPRLRALNLMDSGITRHGFAAILVDWEEPRRCPPGLTCLDLSQNVLGMEGASVLLGVFSILCVL
jgi:hypothetical protein